MNPGTLWALPSPVDAIAVGLAVIVNALWWAARRATLNLATLGPWWPPTYWAAVYLSGRAGVAGTRRLREVRRGNDFREFNPENRGGSWAGAPVHVIRAQVRAEAWIAGGATVVGYGACFALLVVGVLWDWLLVVGASFALTAALRARWMGRVAPWEVEP